MTEQLIKVPDIGGAEGAEVVEVLVAVGDHIDLEQSLIVVESDKASMEIPANLAGTVTTLRVAVGDAMDDDSTLPAAPSARALGDEVSLEQCERLFVCAHFAECRAMCERVYAAYVDDPSAPRGEARAGGDPPPAQGLAQGLVAGHRAAALRPAPPRQHRRIVTQGRRRSGG